MASPPMSLSIDSRVHKLLEASRLAEKQREAEEESKLLDVFFEMDSAKPGPCSPERLKLAKLLRRTDLSQFKPGEIPAFDPSLKPKVLVFSEEEDATAQKCDSLVRREQELLRKFEETPLVPEETKEAENQKARELHGNFKTFEAHVETILNGPKGVKVDYFNFLNILIKEKKLGEPINFVNFTPFYDKLLELVKLLNANDLDEYVLRHSKDSQVSTESDATDRIRALSKDVVADLVSFGFRAPPEGKPIIFWSGPLAKERALAEEGGFTDEQIELIQALWGFDALVSKKEAEKPSKEADGTENNIHLKLIVAFSTVLAEYAEGKDVVYFLGYPDGKINTASVYWKGECPVLMKIARKLDFSFFNHESKDWDGPYDLKDPSQGKVLEKLQIGRQDHGGEKGPKQSSVSITVADTRMILQKWKWYAAMESYLKQLPESTC